MTLVVGVIGAGTMGAGIAQVCLQAGHEVVLYDVDEAAVARGLGRIADGLDRLVQKGRLSTDDRQAALASLRQTYTLESVASGADIVIEAALEDLALKETIFRALGAEAPAGTILATNTSALSVTDIAEAGSRPDWTVGLHFFNPAPVMPLVEVVAGDQTSRAAIDKAVEFATGLGKTAIVCRDSPGFIVNRVNRPFTLEALRMLEAGEASVEGIDSAMVAAGYPMGPFSLMDLVGIDVNLAVAKALWEGFDHAVRFQPSPIQEELVSSGRLGQKTGDGFYAYGPGGQTSTDLSAWAGSYPPTDIVNRIELAIINEAYHGVGEGVAEASDIDRAMKLGANHPYGPFERAGQLGLRAVIDGLARYQKVYGERYRVAPTLWQVASI